MKVLPKFLMMLSLLLVLCPTAHAQLTGTVDGSLNRFPVGFTVNLLSGTYQEETTGNFAFLSPSDVGDTHIDTVYEDRKNGTNLAPPLYVPGNIMVEVAGTSQKLTTYTGDLSYRPDHLYDFYFVAPVAGTYRFYGASIPAGSFSAGAINFVQKGFVASPVPEASGMVSLAILLILGSLAVLVHRKSIAN